MNLIDCHVTKVISVREFNATEEWKLVKGDWGFGNVYTEFMVEYWDDGGQQKKPEQLIFERGTEPDVKPGYIFQH